MAKKTTHGPIYHRPSPISLKEIREELYKLRKFEVQNLWQRSIFLAAFIVILLTGYGHLVDKLLSEPEKWLTHSHSQTLSIHMICCLLCFLGSIFSVIWVMMAKGSKAWYEIHERRIHEIEEELNVIEEYRMKPGAPWDLDNSLYSYEAGCYSVSRINILLGQVLLIVWWFAFYAHFILAILAYATNYQTDGNCISPISGPIFILAALAIAQHIAPHILKRVVKSKAIRPPKTQ